MTELFSLIVAGMAVGTVYGLVALGFVLVYKAAGAINFAHGDFLMVAAYLAFTVAVTYEHALFTTMLASVVGAGVLGALVYLLGAKKLIGAPPFTVILMTIGVAQVIHSILLIAYGPLEKPSLKLLPSGGIEIWGAGVAWTDIIILGVGVVFTVTFFFFFNRTRLGLKMRSVAESVESSLVVGLRPERMFLIAWIIAGLAAGIAGFLYSNRTPVISLGLSAIGLRAFPAAMLGGIESIGGAVVAGMLIGIFEQIAAGYLGAEWRDMVAFSIMFLVLLTRPTGIFGRPEAIRV